MGYGFGCRKRKTDEECVFYTSCMYAYQEAFRECFGKEITEFSGRVTKSKALEFETGVMNFISNAEKYNSDNRQMRGYLDNASFGQLCHDLLEISNLMKNKEIGYIDIG